MDWVETINLFITKNPLIISVAVPLATGTLTFLISQRTIKAHTKAQSHRRELDHQLKLADFRQSWINDMREDLALYTARTWDTPLNKGIEAQKECVMAHARILMRMNPNDPDYEAVCASLLDPVANPDSGRKALFEIGQRILKREWDRLKGDLNQVD